MEYEERLVRVVIARYDDYYTIYPEGYIYVSLDEEDTSEIAERLQTAKRLSIDAGGYYQIEDVLKYLSIDGLETVEELKMERCQIKDMTPFSRMPNLRKLVLNNCHTYSAELISDSIVEVHLKNTRLERIPPTVQSLKLVRKFGELLYDENDWQWILKLPLYRLYIKRYNMGSIPADIDTLSQLEYLWLIGCNLRGEIPKSISNLTRLKILNLANNELEGTVPSLVNLKSLELLNLKRNQLSGEFPPIGSQAKTLCMNLKCNRFSGVNSIANHPGLLKLNVRSNALDECVQLFQDERRIMMGPIIKIDDSAIFSVEGEWNTRSNGTMIYRVDSILTDCAVAIAALLLLRRHNLC